MADHEPEVKSLKAYIDARDEHYDDKFSGITEDISQIKTDVAQQIGSISNQMDRQFASLRDDYRANAKKPSSISPANLYGLLGLLTTIAIIAGMLVNGLVSPIRTQLGQHIADSKERTAAMDTLLIAKIEEDAYEKGKNEIFQEWTRSWMGAIELSSTNNRDNGSRMDTDASALDARIDALETNHDE